MDKKMMEGGQSIVIIAMAFVAIVAFVGFALDSGLIYLNRIWLGQAVDAASLAAGYDLPNIKGACARAVEYLKANDYIANSDFEFDIVFPNVADAPGGDPGAFVINSIFNGISKPEDCSFLTVPTEHQAVHYQVQVVGRQQVQLIFMSILGFGEIEAGIEGLAERTRRFDVALVLDNSWSMKHDTCGYNRTLSTPDEEGYSVYAANNLYPVCTEIVGDDFESYIDTTDLENAMWYTDVDILLHTNSSHDNSSWVQMRADSSNQGRLVMTFSVLGQEEIALFFWAKDESLESDDYLDVQWRVWDGTGTAPGWVPLSRLDGNYIKDAWTQYGIVMPNGAADTEFLQIRFLTRNAETFEGIGIDDVTIKHCPPVREELLPVLQYKSGGSGGCPTNADASPIDAHTYAPQTMIPMVPVDVYSEPVTEFLELPMYHILRSTDKFIDLIDERRFDTTPPREREDQFSLTTFSNTGLLHYDLTLDYEAIKTTLFTGIRAESNTNIGDGMRIGLDTLTSGRPTTMHFMVLLTDGWPNRYSSSGTRCSTPPYPYPCTETLDYIDAQIDYANSQNATIFAIGLGNDLVDVTFNAYGDPSFNGLKLLERIAHNTGGEAYFAPTTDELEQIFEWIAEAIFVRLRE